MFYLRLRSVDHKLKQTITAFCLNSFPYIVYSHVLKKRIKASSEQGTHVIEDIYFFEVNTKYISSSAVEKISIFHECVARVKMLIFSPHEMKYIWYLPKKSKFSLYFILNRNTEITTLLFTWSFLIRFDFCSVFIGYNIGCKHSLHLENG